VRPKNSFPNIAQIAAGVKISRPAALPALQNICTSRYPRGMPLYDFRCPSCKHRFEELVKLDEVPQCPKCGAAPAERLQSFSAAVSTEGSRERALKGARRKAGAEKREKDHAHQEYVRHHMEDHH
jgi:putative FmdB family regulatory protein